LIEKFLARAGVEREVIGKRIAEQQREEHYGRGDAHGAEQDFKIDRIGNERVKVSQVPLMHNHALSHRPEAVSEHKSIRQQQKEPYPE
jgi:hypothetical protein